MVVSQRETSISSNIRAIIKQLNLNPVDRRNYINRDNNHNGDSINHVTKIKIGVYGYNNDDYDVYNQARRKTSPQRQRQRVVLPKLTRGTKDVTKQTNARSKVELPELEVTSLKHTAALHRISVRPKNRRPPKRTGLQNAHASNISTISEVSDSLDSLEFVESNSNSPVESKNVTIIRKSSSRLSKKSEIFEELEAKLPRKPSILSKSPDSLDTSVTSKTTDSVDLDEQQTEIKPVMRKLSNRVSKGSDIFEELEAKLPKRRSSINRSSKSPDSLENTWFSKSTDSFDKLDESEEVKPISRRALNSISKSIDRVSKSSDSLETIDAVNSKDSIERRRSSFEFRARRTVKSMSKSSENFEALEEIQNTNASMDAELQKRNSASDLNLLRGRKPSRMMSKSSESFDTLEPIETKPEPKRSSSDLSKSCWRPTKRMNVSSESSDNLELDDDLENRRARKPPKRIPSTSIVDIVQAKNSEAEKKPPQVRKSTRFQKSSESSELGSTDTLDSDKKNKSSDSTETLDSLERDLEQDRKDEEITDSVVEKRERDDSWPARMTEPTNTEMEDTKSLISDKSYWRQSSESKENIDIHQLLAITIVTRMADNGNQRNSVMFQKKKLSSPPTSPAKQEDNKLLFNNLLSSKNDEDLQNMLNGNISEVSTDTKSFKEKLIMFEKLGK